MKQIIFATASLFLFGSCVKKDINLIEVNKYNFDKHAGEYSATIIHRVINPNSVNPVIDTIYNQDSKIEFINNAYIWENCTLSNIEGNEPLFQIKASTINGFCGTNIISANLKIDTKTGNIVGHKSHCIQYDNKSEFWDYELIKK
jgi:hypothetical protein